MTNTPDYTKNLDYILCAIDDFGKDSVKTKDKTKEKLDKSLYDAFADGYKTCLEEHNYGKE